MECHKWTVAVQFLRKEAKMEYEAYFAATRSAKYHEGKDHYDRYVALNTAAGFLESHPPSGVLNLGKG